MVNLHQSDHEKKQQSAASEVPFHAADRQVYMCFQNMIHVTDQFSPIIGILTTCAVIKTKLLDMTLLFVLRFPII